MYYIDYMYHMYDIFFGRHTITTRWTTTGWSAPCCSYATQIGMAMTACQNIALMSTSKVYVSSMISSISCFWRTTCGRPHDGSPERKNCFSLCLNKHSGIQSSISISRPGIKDCFRVSLPGVHTSVGASLPGIKIIFE